MIPSSWARKIVLLVTLGATLAATGCGSSTTHSSASSATTPTTTTAASSTAAGTAAILPSAVAELPAAERPQQDQFPTARGRTLQGLTAGVRPAGVVGAATGTFTPGRRRFAFALNAGSGAFIYAPTAIYIARGPNRPAQGPFLAPADPLTVPPAFRSAQNAGPGGITAIYETQVPLTEPGTYTVLALTRTRKGLIGSTGEIAVAASSRIPDVGQRPPAVATDTPESVHGQLGLLTTRTPPESMHSASLAAVLGRQPVALLFSTPQFCVSRVCGPVTDIAAWLQTRFGRRITFLHQEVYVMNQPNRGLRPPFKAFGLQTEPWLFTIDRHGRIAARLEGSFGVNAVTGALEAALR